MYGSRNDLTETMMSKYDDNLANDGLPCEKIDRDCDIKVSSQLAYGVDNDTAVAGPDDYIFDKKTFGFMGERYVR